MNKVELAVMNKVELASMNKVVLAVMNKVELASMKKVVLAVMNKVELASMNKVVLAVMNNVRQLSTMLSSHGNNITIMLLQHCSVIIAVITYQQYSEHACSINTTFPLFPAMYTMNNLVASSKQHC